LIFDILRIEFRLGVDILGVDILGVDIQLGRTQAKAWTLKEEEDS